MRHPRSLPGPQRKPVWQRRCRTPGRRHRIPYPNAAKDKMILACCFDIEYATELLLDFFRPSFRHTILAQGSCESYRECRHNQHRTLSLTNSARGHADVRRTVPSILRTNALWRFDSPLARRGATRPRRRGATPAPARPCANSTQRARRGGRRSCAIASAAAAAAGAAIAREEASGGVDGEAAAAC